MKINLHQPEKKNDYYIKWIIKFCNLIGNHVGRKLNKMHPFKLCDKITVKSTNFKIFLIYGNVIIWHMLLSYPYLSQYQPFQHETWWVDIGVRQEERLHCGQNISQQELYMVYLQYYITSYHTHSPSIIPFIFWNVQHTCIPLHMNEHALRRVIHFRGC